eukprot:2998133-Amphidinium_carterae.1
MSYNHAVDVASRPHLESLSTAVHHFLASRGPKLHGSPACLQHDLQHMTVHSTRIAWPPKVAGCYRQHCGCTWASLRSHLSFGLERP